MTWLRPDADQFPHKFQAWQVFLSWESSAIVVPHLTTVRTDTGSLAYTKGLSKAGGEDLGYDDGDSYVGGLPGEDLR